MNESFRSSKEYLKKHRLKLAFGALAVSAVFSLPAIGEHVDDIVENAPVIASAIGASELMFVAGIGIIAASQSKKVFSTDILSKKYISNLTNEGLDNNALLKTGLAVNTIGALGTGMALAYGSVTTLPATMVPSAFALASIDIAATVAIRYNIYKGLQENQSIDD